MGAKIYSIFIKKYIWKSKGRVFSCLFLIIFSFLSLRWQTSYNVLKDLEPFVSHHTSVWSEITDGLTLTLTLCWSKWLGLKSENKPAVKKTAHVPPPPPAIPQAVMMAWCHFLKGELLIRTNVCCAHYQKQWLKFLVLISATVPSGVCSRVMGNTAVSPPENTTLYIDSRFLSVLCSSSSAVSERWSS